MATIIGRALILGGGSSPTPPGPTPISDLTNTVWLFNDSTPVNPMGYNSYSITFSFINAITKGTVTATSIGFSGSGNVFFGYSYQSGNDDYDFGYFTDSYVPFGDVNNWGYSNGLSVTKASLSRVIKITGGTDATDSDLIDWIQENAVQIPADLSGTSWYFNSTLDSSTAKSYGGYYSLQFSSNSNDFTLIGTYYEEN